MNQIYKPKEVAEILKCSVPTVRRLILSGHLPASNITPRTRPTWRVSQEQLDAYLATPYKAEERFVAAPVERKRFLFVGGKG